MLHKGSCMKKLQQKLSHLFLSGYAGVGKSYVIKTIFNTLIKLLNLHSSSPQKVKDLKVAPTAAFFEFISPFEKL